MNEQQIEVLGRMNKMRVSATRLFSACAAPDYALGAPDTIVAEQDCLTCEKREERERKGEEVCKGCGLEHTTKGEVLDQSVKGGPGSGFHGHGGRPGQQGGSSPQQGISLTSPPAGWEYDPLMGAMKMNNLGTRVRILGIKPKGSKFQAEGGERTAGRYTVARATFDTIDEAFKKADAYLSGKAKEL